MTTRGLALNATAPDEAPQCASLAPPCARTCRSGAPILDRAGCLERYHNLLEQAAEGVFMLDQRGRCLDANRSGLSLLGLSRGDALGRNLLRHLTERSSSRLRALAVELQAGRTIRREKRLRRRDGSVFPGEVSLRRLSDGTIQCILMDTTERRQAEQAARSATRRLREIFENSPIGVFLLQVGADGGFLADTINPVLERALQIDREEVRGCALAEVLDPALATDVELQLRQCLAMRRPVECEFTFGAAGVFRHVQVSLFPIHDNGVRIHRVAGFIHEITASKQAEAALRESEEKFARIFRVSPDVIALTDWEAGRLLEVNDSFMRLYRLTRETFRNRTTVEIGFWPDAVTRERFLEALAEKGMLREFEMRWVVGGQERIYLLGAERIDLHGIPSILTVVTDVTAQRRAEQERMEMMRRERRAQEDFTRRLFASQEAERRRIAGELHDSLGQDLLLVKNRLRLALTGAAVPADLRLQLESVETLAAQAIAEVRRIAHALRPGQLDHLGLTRALRAMLDAVARPAAFRLEQRIENIDGVFSPEAEAHFYRIVQEALHNILKHAHAGFVEVVLVHDVHEIRLILADDGCGFTPPAGAPEGLGLRNIAERVRILDGRLRIDSAPGTGTRIEIAVPLPGADGAAAVP